MSAWLIALGLSAGYLINKQMQMAQKLDEKVLEHHSAAAAARPGPATEEIRKVQRTVPDSEKYLDMNVTELPPERIRALQAAREEASAEVAEFEQGPAPIQGVWLNLGDRGF